MITAATLVAAGIPAAQAQRFEAPLQAACARFAIDTPARMAAFVAQCAHESRNFTALEEGLFYRSADRIRAIFSSRVPSVAAAQALVGNPQALANCVYAGRNGNGDEASGDGFRYRGRGLIQLTGRANYERAATALARDYLATPDLVAAADDACLTAGWFWYASKLNALADAGRFEAITRAVNGPAMAGAAERRELFERALQAFAPAPASRSAPKRAARPPGPTKPATSRKPATSTEPAASTRKLASKKRAASKKRSGSTAGAATGRATSSKTAASKKAAAPKPAAAPKRTSTKRAAAPTKAPARKRSTASAPRRATTAKRRSASGRATKPVRA